MAKRGKKRRKSVYSSFGNEDSPVGKENIKQRENVRAGNIVVFSEKRKKKHRRSIGAPLGIMKLRAGKGNIMEGESARASKNVVSLEKRKRNRSKNDVSFGNIKLTAEKVNSEDGENACAVNNVVCSEKRKKKHRKTVNASSPNKDLPVGKENVEKGENARASNILAVSSENLAKGGRGFRKPAKRQEDDSALVTPFRATPKGAVLMRSGPPQEVSSDVGIRPSQVSIEGNNVTLFRYSILFEWSLIRTRPGPAGTGEKLGNDISEPSSTPSEVASAPRVAARTRRHAFGLFPCDRVWPSFCSPK